jgi:hypothetical protein
MQRAAALRADTAKLKVVCVSGSAVAPQIPCLRAGSVERRQALPLAVAPTLDTGMLAKRIVGATHQYGKPSGWDEAENGKCAGLAVRVDGAIYSSAWEPTATELAMLNAGGSLIVSVYGGQPPICLQVTPAQEYCEG